MPIVYDAQSVLLQLVWESANFASGGGTTSLGIYANSNGAQDLQTIVEGVRDAWLDNIRAITDTDVTLDEVRWESQNFSGVVPVATAGSASLSGPPMNTSVLISYKAAEKGPRNRGRSYWPGLLPEGSVDERGVVTPATQATILSAMNAFWADVNAIPEVLSHNIPQTDNPGQSSPPNLPWPQVISLTVGTLAATQRRRLRR